MTTLDEMELRNLIRRKHAAMCRRDFVLMDVFERQIRKLEAKIDREKPGGTDGGRLFTR